MRSRRAKPGPKPRPEAERLGVLLGVRLRREELERLRERSGGRPVASLVRDLIRHWLDDGGLLDRVRVEAERVRADREEVLAMLEEIRGMRRRARRSIDPRRGGKEEGK